MGPRSIRRIRDDRVDLFDVCEDVAPVT